MIIFGWGFQTLKRIGATFKNKCSHCNNEEYWILTRIMTWFTLFFVPVIPYSIKYFLSCPICQYGLNLDREQLETIKPLAETNQLLIDGQITEEEYRTRISQLGGGEPKQVEAQVIETKVLAPANEKLTYCSQCGKEVVKEIKFCGNCGTKTAVPT